MSTAPAKTTAAAKSTAPAKTTPEAKTPAVKKPRATKSARASNATGNAKKPAAKVSAKPNADRLSQVLVMPIISEKATMMAEKRNQVLFKVLRDATKPEIKAAVELMFKVDVESVSTVIQKGKVKRFGKSIGRRDHVKKAYVSLKKGQELNFSGEGA